MSEDKKQPKDKHPKETLEETQEDQLQRISTLISESLKVVDYEEFVENYSSNNLIYVDEVLDLKYLCELMVKDEEEKVEELMVKKLIFTPDTNFLNDLLKVNPEIKLIQISPYTLFQLVKDDD